MHPCALSDNPGDGVDTNPRLSVSAPLKGECVRCNGTVLTSNAVRRLALTFNNVQLDRFYAPTSQVFR